MRVTRSASVEFDVRLQGDADMLQLDAILSRRKLREHPSIKAAMEKWWAAISLKGERGIEKESFLLLRWAPRTASQHH